MPNKQEVLVIGSGAAGMTVALELATKYKVSILSKSAIFATATMDAITTPAVPTPDAGYIIPVLQLYLPPY